MLQANVDAAALAGAREFAMQSAGAIERARLQADGAADTSRPRWTISTTAQANAARGAMTVSQDGARPSLFRNLLPDGSLRVHVTATATTLTKTRPLCVLGIQQKGSNVLELRDSSIVTASDCVVQSNSDIRVIDGARARAGSLRSVGAATGSILPSPTTDAPAIGDPFASMNINFPTSCSDTDFAVSGTTTLSPGVHCGNIKIKGNDWLVLNPGEHYFRDAQIDVVGKGQISGTDVVLLFKGKFDFSLKGQASLSIAGRQTGPFAGFAIVTDRSFTNAVELSTDSARQILGTVYLPSAQLRVSGKGNKIADQSDWTVIVANALRTEGTAELVINSRYAGSAVPVPSGVGTNGATYLSE